MIGSKRRKREDAQLRAQLLVFVQDAIKSGIHERETALFQQVRAGAVSAVESIIAADAQPARDKFALDMIQARLRVLAPLDTLTMLELRQLVHDTEERVRDSGRNCNPPEEVKP